MGYKQTEVGDIPEEWDVVLLGDHFQFKNGLNKAKEFFGFGAPIVNYMDVFQHQGLRLDNIIGRVDVNARELRAYEVCQGDVFFTRTSETVEEVGVASVMLEKPKDTVFSGFLLRARPTDQTLDNQFKGYCFGAGYFRQQVIARASYTTRALINGKSLSDAMLARPSLPEQTAIATALSDTDSLSSSLDRLITKKRDLKQAALQELLTGKTRLPGYVGEWAVLPFGDLAQRCKDRVDPRRDGGGREVIELEHLASGSGRLLGSEKTSKGSSQKSIFQRNDVLFGKLRAYLRKFWLADRSGLCSTEIWVLRANPKVAIGKYVRYLVEMDTFIDVTSMAYGTHMPRSDWDAVARFEVPTPPMDEQLAIAQVLVDMDTEIAVMEQRLIKVKDIREAMMQDLLTGKTRLVTAGGCDA